jgi:4-hydroxybenzoate polyprenyltransferase
MLNKNLMTAVLWARRRNYLYSLPFRSLSTPPPRPPSKQEKDEEVPLNPSMQTWVDTRLPVALQPYARLARMDKPIGTWLLLWPCWWSTALAASPGSLPDMSLLALFGAGAFVMRGAGCTINDMWDADLDQKVARTSSRPLASGVLSQSQAMSFCILQLSVGLGVLVSLPHTLYCFQLGAASLPLVVAYPLMKRFTNYPQAVLGLTFNWGALMGYAAVHGSLDYATVLPLYMSGVAWTMVYDTLYAHQDKVDDVKLGIKSTALTFGSSTKPILHGFALISYGSWLLAGYYGDVANVYYCTGITGAYTHLLWQIETADLDNPQNLWDRFRSNQSVGAIVFGSIVVGNLMQ